MTDQENLIEKTLPAVNELLSSSTPMGAYCLGAICSLAWGDGAELPRHVLELATRCTFISAADELYREFRAGCSLEAFKG
jgi:hypothetical protein